MNISPRNWPARATVARIREAAAEASFGKPLVTNVLRGIIAETIVAEALEPEWQLCSQDYSAWDFERADGLLLEVKQSAVRQSWAHSDAKPSKCSFDIRHRKGRYEGAAYFAEVEPKRYADVYIFAHHGVFDASADHRDPAQWDFYVAPSVTLPNQGKISISRVRALSLKSSFLGLPEAVSQIADRLAPNAPSRN